MVLKPLDETLTAADASPRIPQRSIANPDVVSSGESVTERPEPASPATVNVSAIPPSASIYPTPPSHDEHRNTVTIKQQHDVDDSDVRVPWLKVAILAFVAPLLWFVVQFVVYWILYTLFANVGFFATSVAYSFIVIAKYVLLGLIFYKVFSYLNSWVVPYPFSITLGTSVLVVTSNQLVDHLTRNDLYNLVFSGYVSQASKIATWLGPGIVPLASAIGMLGLTFLFTHFQKTNIRIRYGVGVVLVLLPLLVTLFYEPPLGETLYFDDETGEFTFLTADEADWAVLPTALPAGVADSDSCHTKTARYHIFCDYRFVELPGYLSDEGYEQLDAQYGPFSEVNRVSELWVQIDMGEYDERFEPYMYKDGNCDLLGLSSILGIAPSFRSNNPNIRPPSLKHCTIENTPGGIRVIGSPGEFEGQTLPGYYYFIKDDTIVVLAHRGYNDGFVVGLLTDANYRGALYTFIDGFQSNSQ